MIFRGFGRALIGFGSAIAVVLLGTVPVAAHARLLLRTLLQKLTQQVAGITVLDAITQVETAARYERAIGYEQLTVRLGTL